MQTSPEQSRSLILLTHSVTDRARNPQIARDEYRLLQILWRSPLPVAQPLSLAAAHQPPFFITAAVPGQTRLAADQPAFCRQLAAALSAIHQLALRPADLSFLPRPADVFAARLADSGDAALRRALLQAYPHIRPNPPTLLHGDFWHGNLLWQGEQLQAIIDWEDAMLGDPLADLGKSRLELLWALGEAALESYTAHYLARNPALDASSLPFWDLWGAWRLPHFASFRTYSSEIARMQTQYDRFVAAALAALQK